MSIIILYGEIIWPIKYYNIASNLLAQQQILFPVQQLAGQRMQWSLWQSAEQSPPQNGAIPIDNAISVTTRLAIAVAVSLRDCIH